MPSRRASRSQPRPFAAVFTDDLAVVHFLHKVSGAGDRGVVGGDDDRSAFATETVEEIGLGFVRCALFR
jgi:hypothetical protein